MPNFSTPADSPTRSRRRWPALSTSLRIKVTLGVILPLILILGAFTAIQYSRRRATLLDNLSFFAGYSAQLIEDNLLHQMLKTDFEGVQLLLDTIGQREEFRAVYILDAKGKVVFAPGEEGIGRRLNNEDITCQPCHSLPAEERPASIVFTNADGESIFRSMRPFENRPACQECHEDDGRIIGLLLTDVSMAPVKAALSADLRENLLWWAGTILVTVLVVNLVISRLVLRRLERLSAAIAGFGRGITLPIQADTAADEIGELTSSFAVMAQRIEERRRENRALSERLHRQSAQRGQLLKRLITAQEDERKRVARELHDELGQRLAGLSLRVAVADRLLASDQQRAHEQLEEIRTLTAATTAQMYDIILDLRPSVLDDLGLVPALRAYAKHSLNHNELKFQLDAHEFSRRLPAEIETAIFRIFQEALNNAVRHSRATSVHATLACPGNLFTGEVVDNGSGFNADSIQLDGQSGRGLGLLGMQERAAQCGGRLEIISQPGHGTRVKIEIPLPEE